MKLSRESLNRLAGRLSQKARPALVVAAGALVLAGLQAARLTARRHALEARAEIRRLDERLQDAREALDENQSAAETRARELSRFKTQVARLTVSRRALFEGGLEIEEEKRLLEKQWEIMTTYLLVDAENRKIHVMRGEQSLETYPIAYAPPQRFGQTKAEGPPQLTEIVSKERYAHPERGKAEEVDGQLHWTPPQVGTSKRASALGEYVMFTKSELILHGPPRKAAEHKAFAHFCLGLSLPVARRLYDESYIGTKILVKGAPKEERRQVRR